MFLCVILISGYHVAIYVFGFLPLLLRHHPALFLLEPIWTLGQCWLSHSHCVPSLSLRANEMAAGTMELIWAGLANAINILAYTSIANTLRLQKESVCAHPITSQFSYSWCVNSPVFINDPVSQKHWNHNGLLLSLPPPGARTCSWAWYKLFGVRVHQDRK